MSCWEHFCLSYFILFSLILVLKNHIFLIFNHSTVLNCKEGESFCTLISLHCDPLPFQNIIFNKFNPHLYLHNSEGKIMKTKLLRQSKAKRFSQPYCDHRSPRSMIRNTQKMILKEHETQRRCKADQLIRYTKFLRITLKAKNKFISPNLINNPLPPLLQF